MQTVQNVSEILRSIKMCPKYRGYAYLLLGLSITLENNTAAYNISGRIYPHIAAHFNVSCAQVERSLRFVIRRTWESSASGFMRALFSDYGIDYSPTNREFIAVMTEYALHGHGIAIFPQPALVESAPQTKPQGAPPKLLTNGRPSAE